MVVGKKVQPGLLRKLLSFQTSERGEAASVTLSSAYVLRSWFTARKERCSEEAYLGDSHCNLGNEVQRSLLLCCPGPIWANTVQE